MGARPGGAQERECVGEEGEGSVEENRILFRLTSGHVYVFCIQSLHLINQMPLYMEYIKLPS